MAMAPEQREKIRQRRSAVNYMPSGSKLLRRTAALAIAAAALPATIAAFTQSIAARVPAVAIAGMNFDGIAAGKLGLAMLLSNPAVVDRSAAAPKEAVNLLERAILAEPLNPPAFHGLALSYRAGEESPKLDPFVAAALRSYPRSVPLLGLSLELAAANNRIEAAYADLDRLTMLRKQRVRDMMPAIVQYSLNSPDDRMITESLAKEPLWAPLFFATAIKNKSGLSRLGAVRADLGDSKVSNDTLDQAMIQKLADAGDFETAWRIYAIHRPEILKSDVGRLSDSAKYGPFEWDLVSNETQTVSLETGGALRLDILTGGSTAASRVIKLPAGFWQLDADIQREGAGNQNIDADISCAESGRELASKSIGTGMRKLGLQFTTSSECPFVQLTFTTERNYDATPVVVTLKNLTIKR